MCRSVGSPVIAKSPPSPRATSESVERSSSSSDSSSGTHDEADADAVLGGDVLERAHHRRQPALHVVGAATDQPVALDARRELLGAAGNDIQVAVPDDARGIGAPRADVGDEHGKSVVVVVGDRRCRWIRASP